MASRYRKIDPRIWNDEKFRSLTDDGKFIFLFLLTHPHMTAIGAMRSTLPGLAAELGWSIKRFVSGARESMTLGIVEVSDNASWVAIPNFLKYNEPEGPNSVVKAWIAALDMIPECREKYRLIERCRTYLQSRSAAFKHAMGDAIWDAFRDAKSEPCHIQEQEPNKDMPPAVELEFESFWNLYPMRNGKRLGQLEARAKFQKIKPEDCPLILTAVKNYAASEMVQKGIGIRDAHRWLRDGKNIEPWRDWLTPESKKETPNGKGKLSHSGFASKDYESGAF